MLPGLAIPMVIAAAVAAADPEFIAVGTQATGTTSVAVAYPAGIQANDIIFLWVSADSSPSIGSATGFTAESQLDQANLGVRLFWKRATGSESGSVTVSTSGGAAARGVMCLVRNAITSGTPYQDYAAIAASSATSNSAACTTFGTNWLLVGFRAHASANSGLTTPAPWTERLDAGTTGMQHISSYLKPTSGSQAGWTHSQTNDDWISVTVAVIPASYTPIADSTKTTSGTQTVSRPPGATVAILMCFGAGGGGGTGSLNAGGGGGGGGAYARVNARSVGSLSALYFDVGSGGSAGGGSGGTTRIRENNSSGTIICSAPGGSAGGNQSGPPPTGGSGGPGGSGTPGTGDVKYSGGNGSAGQPTASSPGGPGGGGGGSMKAGSGQSGGQGEPEGGTGGDSGFSGSGPGAGGSGSNADVPAGTGGATGTPGGIYVKWGTG